MPYSRHDKCFSAVSSLVAFSDIHSFVKLVHLNADYSRVGVQSQSDTLVAFGD